MEQSTTIERAGYAEAPSRNARSSPVVLSPLIQSATLEFFASVQLLVERARFVTGATKVALALKENSQFVYCASSGSAGPETGTPADMRNKMLQQCVETGQPTRSSESHSSAADVFALAVPIIRAQKVSGFFQLTAGQSFRDTDVDAIFRLTEIVNTALEHHEAAEQVDDRLFQATLATTHVASPVPNAEAVIPAEASPSPEIQSRGITTVHSCKSCGFPISLSRELCLDCEEKFPNANMVPSNELFALPKQESWIGAHGYTIATLVVTALAVAIIYWLR
jgi:hypothetical protein